MFASDKRPGFVMIDPKLQPTNLHYLVIGALHPNHIEETFNLSLTMQGESPSEYITFGSDSIRSEYFRRLYAATGGLPRFIQYVIMVTCIKVRHINSLDDISRALYLGHSKMMEVGYRNHFYVPKSLISNSDYYEAYVTLLACAALQVPLKMDSLVLVGDVKVPLLQLVDLFTFSLDKQEDKTFVLLKISSWTFRNFRDHSQLATFHDFRIPFLKILLAYPEFVGPELMLEYLLHATLLSRLNRSGKENTLCSTLPFFHLSPELATTNVKIGLIKSSFLPKLNPSGLAPSITQEDIELLRKKTRRRWPPTFSINGYWESLCDQGGLFLLHTIGVPAPCSHSPDLLHHLPDLICGYLCKGGRSISWNDLCDEITKATALLQTKKKVCLVLVAMKFETELEAAVTNSGNPVGLRISSGSWGYEDNKLIQILGEDLDGSRVVLTLPNDMELLGKSQLLLLRELINSRLNPEKLSEIHLTLLGEE